MDAGLRTMVAGTFLEILALNPSAIVAVDMPIGLPERKPAVAVGRNRSSGRCLGAANRACLRFPPEAQSMPKIIVLPAPPRWRLPTRRARCRARPFNLFRKIREIDALMNCEMREPGVRGSSGTGLLAAERRAMRCRSRRKSKAASTRPAWRSGGNCWCAIISIRRSCRSRRRAGRPPTISSMPAPAWPSHGGSAPASPGRFPIRRFAPNRVRAWRSGRERIGEWRLPAAARGLIEGRQFQG